MTRSQYGKSLANKTGTKKNVSFLKNDTPIRSNGATIEEQSNDGVLRKNDVNLFADKLANDKMK